jgi:hypothetical protein
MDAYYGNNHLFNPSTFASSRKFWTSSVLTAEQLANSKILRQIDSRAFNPSYTFTSTMEQFSLGELAAPIIAFGDSEAGTADRALVEYFFGMCNTVCVVLSDRTQQALMIPSLQRTNASLLRSAGPRRMRRSRSRTSCWLSNTSAMRPT